MRKTRFYLSPPLLSYLFIFMFLMVFTSCEKEVLPEISGSPLETTLDLEKAEKSKIKTNTFYGPAGRMGDGVVRTMVTMTHDGVPVEIGIRISEKALEGLSQESVVTTLQLPNKMEGLSFDHVDLNWNPHGHEPEGLYGAEHFDVHFFMVSTAYKAGITEPAKAVDYPDAIYRPVNYSPPPPFVPAVAQLVPNMGVHWTSNDEPAFFTHTFIYGSYDDSFIFMEPMVTVAYLKNHTSDTAFEIAQPEEFERSGYYPTTYKIYYDEKFKDYVISMGDMVWYD